MMLFLLKFALLASVVSSWKKIPNFLRRKAAIVLRSEVTGLLQDTGLSVAIKSVIRNTREVLNQKLSDEEDEEDDEDKNPAPEQVSLPSDDTISLMKASPSSDASINGSDVRVGIIMARWNADVVQNLYKGVNESLTACGVQPSNVFTTYVPGSFELPITAKFLAMSKRVDVIVCLGCLVKGDTMHFEYIAEATSQGIMKVSLDTLVPCIFGVLTVLNKEQAMVRCTGDKNEGLGWGRSAVEMALARMSALGFDKPKQQKDTTNNFVTFSSGNSTATDKTGEAQPKKKIAF